MTRQERAKQFMPFDAMKGLQAALRDREERHSRVDRRVLSDEAIAANSAVPAPPYASNAGVVRKKRNNDPGKPGFVEMLWMTRRDSALAKITPTDSNLRGILRFAQDDKQSAYCETQARATNLTKVHTSSHRLFHKCNKTEKTPFFPLFFLLYHSILVMLKKQFC